MPPTPPDDATLQVVERTVSALTIDAGHHRGSTCGIDGIGSDNPTGTTCSMASCSGSGSASASADPMGSYHSSVGAFRISDPSCSSFRAVEPGLQASTEAEQTAAAVATAATEEAVAIPVNDADTPSAIGVQIRATSEDGDGAADGRRAQEEARAAAAEAYYMSTYSITDRGSARAIVEAIDVQVRNERHPRADYKDLVERMERYHLCRWIFRGLVLVSILALGLGLGLGLRRRGSESPDVASSSKGGNGHGRLNGTRSVDPPILEGFTLERVGLLEGEAAGDEFGAAIWLALNAEQVGVSAPGSATATARVFKTTPLSDSPDMSADDVALSDLMSVSAEPQPGNRTILSTTSVDGTTFGDHIAIGYTSEPTSGRRGYVKVFHLKDKDAGEYHQVGNTLYGETAGDGYGSSIALGPAPSKEGASSPSFQVAGLRLAIGSNSGYVHLWGTAADENGIFGDWVRLDRGELDDDSQEETSETVVEMAGNGLRLFVGYPLFNNGKGVVKAYSIGSDLVGKTDPDVAISQSTVEISGSGADIVAIRQLGASLAGVEDGDMYGAALSIDLTGSFVAIGTRGGGYVEMMMWYDALEAWQPVGERIRAPISSQSTTFGSAISTARRPFNSCRLCPFTIDGRRVIVGSPGYDKTAKATAVGMATIYQFDEADYQWKRISRIDGEHTDERVGMAVAMSPDSEFVAVGSPLANGRRGRVDVYRVVQQQV